MKACTRMAVLIPARNEEALLHRCLHSVLRAQGALPAGVHCDVIVVSDGSTDGTEIVAKSLLGSRGVVVRTRAVGVGKARALAAKTALSRIAAGQIAQCWLANTDADCVVPETWLVRQLDLSERVAAVAGIVDVDSFGEHLPHVELRFRQTYLIDEAGTHPHVHGANLGVRADAYLLAGGWGTQRTAEDHDLWSRLAATGAVCASDASLQVVTSGRRVGRAPNGFADALAEHNRYVTVGGAAA